MLLLVDDNDEFRKAAAETLEAAGLVVAEAVDAEEAWAIFQEEDISLLVTDLRLPGSRPTHLSAGEELAKRCLAKNPRLPIIVVSSHADADLPTRLGSAQVEILAKPFPLEKLARRSIALLAGEPAESTGALPAAVMKKRQDDVEERSRKNPPRQRGRVSLLVLAAVCLGLVILFAWLATRPGSPAPSTPKTTAQTPNPEATIKPLAPVGPIGVLPAELVWQPVSGSERYRVDLRGVDDIVLWRGEAKTSHIALPQEIGRELRPALAYYWSVEALSPDGDRLAAAAKVRFRFVPTAKTSASTTGG